MFWIWCFLVSSSYLDYQIEGQLLFQACNSLLSLGQLVVAVSYALLKTWWSKQRNRKKLDLKTERLLAIVKHNCCCQYNKPGKFQSIDFLSVRGYLCGATLVFFSLFLSDILAVNLVEKKVTSKWRMKAVFSENKHMKVRWP